MCVHKKASNGGHTHVEKGENRPQKEPYDMSTNMNVNVITK